MEFKDNKVKVTPDDITSLTKTLEILKTECGNNFPNYCAGCPFSYDEGCECILVDGEILLGKISGIMIRLNENEYGG